MIISSLFISILICLFLLVDFIRLFIAGCYTIYEVVVCLIALTTIVLLVFSFKNIRNHKNSVFILSAIIFCLLICFIEIYHSGINNVVVLSESICWIVLPALFIVYKPTKKEIDSILSLFVILNLFVAIPSVLNHFVDLPGVTDPGIIFVDDCGYYGNRNVNAMINAMSIVCCIKMYINKDGKSKKIMFIPAIINLLSLLFSGSRTSLLSLLFVVFIYFMYFIKNKIVRLFISLGAFCSSIFVALFRFKDIIFNSKLSPEFLNTLSSGRYFIWEEMIQMMKYSLWTGFGVNTVKENAIKLLGEAAELAEAKSTINNAHNIFINILYNSGLIAMLYFVWLCIYYVKIIFKSPITLQRLSSLMVVLCGFLIAMLDVPLLYTTSVINIIWWLFVFYTVSEA